MVRWWPIHTSTAAYARSKISSYKNDGWNVLYFMSAAGMPDVSRAAWVISSPHGRLVGLPNSSWLK
jgi:hypothetical protein